jgi:hypothetical protein
MFASSTETQDQLSNMTVGSLGLCNKKTGKQEIETAWLHRRISFVPNNTIQARMSDDVWTMKKKQ